MKSLSLSRPLILMVIGVPGSGKSFFARQFASTFSTPLVSHDYIRSRLVTTPTYSKREEAVVYSIADQQITELLKTEKSFIIDGGLNDKPSRDSLTKLATKSKYGVLVVWVQTDEASSKQRSTRRSAKRDGDAYNSSISAELFAALSQHLMPPAAQETHVVVSGKHTFATQAKVVLKKLVSPREDTPRRNVPTVPPTHPNHGKSTPTPPRRNVIIG